VSGSGNATRTLVVWCADWPVVAAGVALDVPAAVLRANRVVACSPAARADGVERHQRRRDAQSRCPELVLIPHDPAAEARAFEPVAGSLEVLTPRIEITYPGACAFPTRGPSRYHGGDEALADRAARLAASALRGRGPVRVGVADGPFAAALAARRRHAGADADAGAGASADAGDPPATSTGPTAVRVIAPGATPDFLAPIPVTVLADVGGPAGADLVDVSLPPRMIGPVARAPETYGPVAVRVADGDEAATARRAGAQVVLASPDVAAAAIDGGDGTVVIVDDLDDVPAAHAFAAARRLPLGVDASRWHGPEAAAREAAAIALGCRLVRTADVRRSRRVAEVMAAILGARRPPP